MEGPFGGGLIANEDSEFGKGHTELEMELDFAVQEAGGAQVDPVMVGHLFDQNLLGRGGRLVLSEQVIEQQVEDGGIFAGHETGTGREAVREAIAGNLALPSSVLGPVDF